MAPPIIMPSDIWGQIDYLAFHENAILLDAILRSLGSRFRSSTDNDDQPQSQDALSPQLVRHVLDDFALVLCGNGGKENVSAVCMEHDEELRTITFRASSNDGIEPQKLQDTQRLLQLIMGESGSDVEHRSDGVLVAILQQCTLAFLKQVKKFSNELEEAQCSSDELLRTPPFSLQGGHTESTTDTEVLGPYRTESHRAYMELSSERLRTLRRLSEDLATSGGEHDIHKMSILAKAAYHSKTLGVGFEGSQPERTLGDTSVLQPSHLHDSASRSRSANSPISIHNNKSVSNVSAGAAVSSTTPPPPVLQDEAYSWFKKELLSSTDTYTEKRAQEE
ncbi:hypothetical protein B0A52_04281 [Exophiala mesophila]|uniref:Uncharacterized protein n=1 Tax=Exophiala mesophila TaxID=212818 RepID=A0A438N814_EXOME|nr:hypothetical protein B0A52_04281 [Exophiala mesophila]